MADKQVVYITGGSKGIGQGIAHYLLNKGYKVAVSSRTLAHAQEALQALEGKEEDKLALQSDVRKREDEEAAVKKILDHWGRLDVVVPNAGLGVYKSIEELSHEEWHLMLDTNLTGVFNTVKAALAPVKKAKGYIIVVASMQGIYFAPKSTGYNAAKFGVVGFTQALMQDLRQQDVKVTALCPGSVSTHFAGNVPSELDAWKIQPEDMGEVVYDILQMNPRVLPSKIELRPSKPPVK